MADELIPPYEPGLDPENPAPVVVTSAEFTVEDSPVTLMLSQDADGHITERDAMVRVMIKNSHDRFLIIGMLTRSAPFMSLTMRGTYVVRRLTGTVGVDIEEAPANPDPNPGD